MFRDRKFIAILIAGTLFLAQVSNGGDKKEEKVYELIYKDVQLIKQTLLRLENKINKNQEELVRLQKNMAHWEELLTGIRLEQASLKDKQEEIPLIYQAILEKLGSLYLDLQNTNQEIATLKRILSPPEEEQGEIAPPEQGPQKEEVQPKEPPPEKMPLPPDLSPQEIFNLAREDYLKGHYDLAIEGFKIYKDNFPESPLADNASYWIGESLYSQEKYEEAVNQFNELILNYPFSDKIASAYLKKGLSLLQMGKQEEALTVFKLLVSKFPLEEETKVAQEKIKELTEKK